MTMSAFGEQAASTESAMTHDAQRKRFLLAQFGDAANRVERGHGISARCLRCRGGSGSSEPIADVQQDFEQQLLALVGGVEVRHATFVARFFCAVVGFSIDSVQIVENLLARPWTHAGKSYRSVGLSDSLTV